MQTSWRMRTEIQNTRLTRKKKSHGQFVFDQQINAHSHSSRSFCFLPELSLCHTDLRGYLFALSHSLLYKCRGCDSQIGFSLIPAWALSLSQLSWRRSSLTFSRVTIQVQRVWQPKRVRASQTVSLKLTHRVWSPLTDLVRGLRGDCAGGQHEFAWHFPLALALLFREYAILHMSGTIIYTPCHLVHVVTVSFLVSHDMRVMSHESWVMSHESWLMTLMTHDSSDFG